MKRIRIRGKAYTLRFVEEIDDTGTRGYCDSPSTPHREIRILDSLEGEEFIEVLLHEMLHAALWDISEESVTETAIDLAKVLNEVVIEGCEDG